VLSFCAVHLPLLQHVHGLDTGNQFLCAPERLEPQHAVGDPFHRPLVLLNDVVEVFGLAQSNIQAGVIIDAANGSGVGATFVDGCIPTFSCNGA
jgi:hypothetical protein